MSGRTTTYLAAFAAACALTSVFITGATADPTESSSAPSSESQPSVPPSSQKREVAPTATPPPVEVTGEFDKPSYRTGDLITIKFRVKNVGDAPIAHLHAFDQPTNPTALQFDIGQWGDLAPPDLSGNPAGATIEPGATLEVTLSGHVRTPDATVVTLTGQVVVEHAAPGENRAFAFSAPVEQRTSHVAGTIFGDRNGNGRFDSGEELSGATFTLRDNIGFSVSAVSGAGGRFDFGQIPTISYLTGGTATNFLVPFLQIDINADNDNTNLLIRAVPPLNGALHASMKFTKDAYQKGDVAHVIVTLSNSGSIPLVGIVAACDRSGEGPALQGRGPGWGKLAIGTGGVTLRPGETKDFHVSEDIPDGDFDFGFVRVDCDFGFEEIEIDNHPTASDTANLLGVVANFLGTILAVQDGSTQPVGLAGVRVVLVGVGSCPVVGDGATDSDGNFEFTNLAPGPDYKLYLVPPAGFNFGSDNPTSVQVVANRTGRLTLVAERGDAPPPVIPTNPASCTETTTTTAPPTTTTSPTPAPQGRSSSGLASTGANVAGLSALGLIALLLGGTVVLGTRRRRRTEV